MKTYKVEIKETLSLTVEVEAENIRQAEDMVRESYDKADYILDAEHFTGVEITAHDRKHRNHVLER